MQICGFIRLPHERIKWMIWCESETVYSVLLVWIFCYEIASNVNYNLFVLTHRNIRFVPVNRFFRYCMLMLTYGLFHCELLLLSHGSLCSIYLCLSFCFIIFSWAIVERCIKLPSQYLYTNRKKNSTIVIVFHWVAFISWKCTKNIGNLVKLYLWFWSVEVWVQPS